VISYSDLRTLASARLADARTLLDAGRLDGAAYLCGYVVELALKARICRALKWTEYPDDQKGYQTFKTHDLDVLLHLSGREPAVKLKLFAEWNIVKAWHPESRYHPVGTAERANVQQMLAAAESLMRKL